MGLKRKIKQKASQMTGLAAPLLPLYYRLQAWLLDLYQRTGVQQWHAGQNSDNKLALRTASIVVLAVIVLTLVWLLLQRQLLASERDHSEAVHALQWLQSHRPQQGQGLDQPLATILINSARQYQVPLTQFQPQGNGLIAISAENVSFHQMTLWLQYLGHLNLVRVEQAALNPTQLQGRADVRITFADF